MRVPLGAAQKRLASLWFGVSGLLFALLFLQTVLGRYRDRAADAWGWLLPTILPTLSLIVGVLVMSAIAKGSQQETVDRFVYRLALGLSTAYLVLVSATVLASPLAEIYAGTAPLELMELSHLWLAPCQGLVTAALGAFFVTKK